MRLSELVATHLPESHSRGQETWGQHADFLWDTESLWMTELRHAMRTLGRWLYGPVELHGGHVQDGHHRIVLALELGWHNRDIPVVHIDKP